MSEVERSRRGGRRRSAVCPPVCRRTRTARPAGTWGPCRLPRRPTQPGVQARLRRVPRTSTCWPGGSSARPRCSGWLTGRWATCALPAASQRRVVHGELWPGLRPVAHGLPLLVAAGGSLRPDSALHGNGLRPAAEPHVSRRPGGRRLV